MKLKLQVHQLILSACFKNLPDRTGNDYLLDSRSAYQSKADHRAGYLYPQSFPAFKNRINKQRLNSY